MADAFTEANRLSTQVAAIDRQRAVITTREKAKQDAIDREIQRKQARQNIQIKSNAEARTNTLFNDQQASKEPLDIVGQKFAVLAQELKATQGKLDKQESFDAFRRFIVDGDPKHLNQLFADNPRIKSAEAAGGSPIASFDKVDVNNDQVLLGQAKIDPTEFAASDAVKNFIKVTHADGTKEILDMNKLFRGTGFAATLQNEQLDMLIKRAKIAKLNKPDAGPKLNLSQDLNDLNSLAKTLRGANVTGPVTPDQLKAAAEFKQTILPNAVKTPTPTAAQKNIGAADSREVSLFNKFGGQEGFFNTDFSKPENRRKASADIGALEKLRGVKFSNAEKKKFRELNKLINLSSISTDDLNSKTTGIIDDALSNVKKFISNNVQGVKGRAAYAAYRNVIRHSMFGSVLTVGEIRSFNQAFGSLGQQLGPVLDQLRVSVQTIKSDLNSISNTGDATIAHFRLGASQSKIDEVISRLDDRLVELGNVSNDGMLKPIAPSNRLNLNQNKTSNAPKQSISQFNFTTGAN